MEALSSQSAINRYYDSTVRGLVAESKELVSEAKEKSESQGWFNWMWGGGKPANDPLTIKQGEIENLKVKLESLEQKATETEMLGVSAKGGAQVLAQQRMLAVKELMVEVKLSIADNILEEYAIKFGKDHENYKAMASKIAEFKEKVNTEGKELLHQEAAFWGYVKSMTKYK